MPTPHWTKERPELTLVVAAIAGAKIQQNNRFTQVSIEGEKGRSRSQKVSLYSQAVISAGGEAGGGESTSEKYF